MWNWIKCRFFGIHNWKETSRRYTMDLDDVYEKCSVCGDERHRPHW